MDGRSATLILIGCVVLYCVLRWLRLRRQLFRITDKIDDMLTAQGTLAVDFYRTPELRSHLGLAQIADRMEQRVDKLLLSHTAQQQNAHNKQA